MARRARNAPYTKVLSINDYSEGMNRRKSWEVANAFTALNELSILTPDATILGVGAGIDPLGFMISPQVKWVFITDLYFEGGWEGTTPKTMLRDVREHSQGIGDPNRIIAIHRNALNLGFPDEAFEVVYSLGSIEHFGTWDDVAVATAGIGRSLKPGGIAVITTEFNIGDKQGDGWPGVLLFTPETIRKYIVEPSGLQFVDVDETSLKADAETIAAAWPLGDIVSQNAWPEEEAALTHEGYTFTSVQLVLTKPGTPPPAKTKASPRTKTTR